MGKLGELRYEARAATQRARRAERALRDKEQELEELKAKCASLARERSALSARLSERAPANNAGVHKNPFGASGASHGSSAFAPRTTNAGGAHVATPKSPFSTTPRKPSGESLSLSSRWNQWEMEARRGDKRLAMLMRGYKEIEGELEAARASARVARESVAFSEDELEATRGALEELRGNFEAAKELLNEGPRGARRAGTARSFGVEKERGDFA
jgi:chromosome segregation ATPase